MSKVQITIDCGCEGSKSPEPKASKPKGRRNFPDEAVRKWVKEWRTSYKPFTKIAEEAGTTSDSVGYNVYRVTALDALREIAELKEALRRCRLRSAELLDVVAQYKSKYGEL